MRRRDQPLGRQPNHPPPRPRQRIRIGSPRHPPPRTRPHSTGSIPFQEALIPLNVWVDQGLDWLVDNFRPVFQAIRWPIDAILTSVESALQAAPALLVILIFVLLPGKWSDAAWRWVR